MSASRTCRISRARSMRNSAPRRGSTGAPPEHDPEKHVLDRDRGWEPVFGQDHARFIERNFLQVFPPLPSYLSADIAEAAMLNHVSIGVRDVARSKRFYDAALK